MLGLGDFWVSLVFVLLIASTLLCVVYGAVNWNNGGEDDELLAREQQWEEEEKEIEDKL